MMQAYEKISVQDAIVLTFLGVRAYGFDPNSFLEVSANQWNNYFGLNRPRT